MVLSMHENWTLSAGFGYVDAEWDEGTLFASSPDNVIDLSGRDAAQHCGLERPPRRWITTSR